MARILNTNIFKYSSSQSRADQTFATTTKCCTGQVNERLHLVIDTYILYIEMYLHIFGIIDTYEGLKNNKKNKENNESELRKIP